MIKRSVVIGLLVGFCVPAAAVLLSMLAFNAPAGKGADAFWAVINVVSPGWSSINSATSFLAVSLLDAFIYAAAAVALAIIFRAIRQVLKPS